MIGKLNFLPGGGFFRFSFHAFGGGAAWYSASVFFHSMGYALS